MFGDADAIKPSNYAAAGDDREHGDPRAHDRLGIIGFASNLLSGRAYVLISLLPPDANRTDHNICLHACTNGLLAQQLFPPKITYTEYIVAAKTKQHFFSLLTCQR